VTLSILTLLATTPFISCRCGSGIEQLGSGFDAEPTRVDFGRAVIGQRVTRTIKVIASGRASVTVRAATQSPFSSAASVEVPGASERNLEVTFVAGLGSSEATLTLSTDDATKSVTLVGEGVKALDCLPSAPCRSAEFSVSANACVETILPDDTSCEPTSLCLERGRCKMGQCLGVARNCDDNNKCTVDACAADIGCVHAPVSCPRPNKPCEVATCSPSKGCDIGKAPDLSICGAVDCVKANVCTSGLCTSIDTPEGFKCGEAIACLPEAQCRDKKCVRADAGEWMPEWQQTLPYTQSESQSALIEYQGALYLTVCGISNQLLDGGTDGGLVADSGTSCGLLSLTGSGFERFVTRFADGEMGQVVSADPTQVVVALDAGVTLFSPLKGLPVETLPVAPVSLSALATNADFTLSWIAQVDGGRALFAQRDGGFFARAPLPNAASTLAIDQQDTSWALGIEGSLWGLRADGGIAFVDAGPNAGFLSANGGVLSLDTEQLISTSLAGSPVLALPRTTGTYEPLPGEMLLSGQQGAVFFNRCPSPMSSCLDSVKELWVRVLDTLNGQTQWELRVGPPSTPARLREAAVVDVPGTGLISVASSTVDGTPVTEAVAVANGRFLGVCPVPVAGTIRSARLTPTQLVISAEQDGGLQLSSFPLGSLPLQFTGWPTANGLSGQRRAR
jgi:Dictyostelium (slime mold) repeat